MKSRWKILTSIASVMLSIMLLITFVLFSNKEKNGTQIAVTHTVKLLQSALDVQSVFDEFEDSSLIRDGSTVYFEGYKSIDSTVLSDADYISESDIDNLENCVVKYNFSYDTETNIVTISALATLQDGSIQVDEIAGVGFIDDKNEIDAVVNIDGEGILLSEMRNAGMIENCGWFSKLIKSVAKAVTVVSVAVVAVAAIVVTAGTAAPAVVAAGVGVSTTVISGMVATATTIGAYFSITAAIAAGVYVTADQIDRIPYNGVNYDAEELTDKKIKKLPTTTYYLAIAASDGKMVFCATPIARSLAVAVMRANTAVSIYTYKDISARGIAQEASNFMSPLWEYRHQSGYFNHYHLGNLSIRGEIHSICKSHAFYGFPVV